VTRSHSRQVVRRERAGTGALLGGILRFLAVGLIPFPLLYGRFIIPLNLWLVGLGVLMWRRGRRGAEWATASGGLDVVRG
jgi:hypothetical protein